MLKVSYDDHQKHKVAAAVSCTCCETFCSFSSSLFTWGNIAHLFQSTTSKELTAALHHLNKLYHIKAQKKIVLPCTQNLATTHINIFWLLPSVDRTQLIIIVAQNYDTRMCCSIQSIINSSLFKAESIQCHIKQLSCYCFGYYGSTTILNIFILRAIKFYRFHYTFIYSIYSDKNKNKNT